MAKGKNGGLTIIKKEEVVEGGHHGGAWKVAYADFVTAMMAFFLLMWLLNATTEAQRKGLADYFAPSNALSRSSSGAGMPLGGKSAFDKGELHSDKGAATLITGRAPPPPDEDSDGDSVAAPGATVDGQAGEPSTAGGNAKTPTEQTGQRAAGGGAAVEAAAAAAKAEYLAHAGSGVAKTPGGKDAVQKAAEKAAEQAEKAAAERAAFEQAAQQIRDAVRNDPALADLARQLAIDLTPEGLRIQMLDEDRQPMFATGSSSPNERARALLAKIVPALQRLDGAISVAGHTDSAQYPSGARGNWELSTERANATRQLLVGAGLPEARFKEVTGHADRVLLLPGDPLAAANRRIAIVVLRASPAK